MDAHRGRLDAAAGGSGADLPCVPRLHHRPQCMTEPLDSTPSDSTHSNASLAALLLTNRLAAVAAKPFTSSEFWRLVGSCGRLDELLTADVAGISLRAGVDDDEAVRIRTLLDASRAFAFERERLEDGG